MKKFAFLAAVVAATACVGLSFSGCFGLSNPLHIPNGTYYEVDVAHAPDAINNFIPIAKYRIKGNKVTLLTDIPNVKGFKSTGKITASGFSFSYKTHNALFNKDFTTKMTTSVEPFDKETMTFKAGDKHYIKGENAIAGANH